MTAADVGAKVAAMPLVLVVEDEPALAQAIEAYLRNDNFRTERARDGLQALSLFRAARPDLVILDLGLPGIDGLDVLKVIRQESNVAVIILTARAEEVDELIGLGLGADDYLVKPVSARKLMARVKAVLRRGDGHVDLKKTVLRVDELDIDTYRMKASVCGQQLELTPTEFRILHHLAKTPGRAITRMELLEVAMPESEALERAIDIHLSNLRAKLQKASSKRYIETVRGVGYRLRDA